MISMNQADAPGGASAAEQLAADAFAKLRETNRLLNMAERLANFGHWQLNVCSGEVEASHEARSIAGIHPHEAISIASALKLIAPADRRLLIGGARRARLADEDVSCRVRIRRTDDQVCYAVVQMQREEKADGLPPGLFGVIQDVTNVVAIENSLIAMRDRAEAETRAKSEFLATMSHEIRTPMTGVLGLIELLGTEPREEERSRYLCAMVQSAELLMAVLDGILDFSKAESGMLELRTESFDLKALANRTLQMFENSSSKKGLLLKLDFPADVSPFVIGDPIRIQQILINLVSNAVKFTETGGVELVVKSKPLDGQRNLWNLQVKDTGVGISSTKLDQVFEPFVQVGRQHSGGTGLGLAISRRLIEAMNGKTGVESVPGSGSTFWFEVELPVGVPTSALNLRPVQNGSALNVLLAEDNRVNQMIIAALLKGLGYTVTCVGNGRQAVEAASKQPFDCIFMDMQMPVMDGIAATHAIRTSGGLNAKAPIIALTADAAPERRRFYENVGLTGFLTKPVSREALHVQVASLNLSGARTERQQFAIDPERLSELREALGMEHTDSILHLLVAELPMWLKQLRLSIEEGRLEDILRQAHDLKGAAANVGADEVAKAARRVEQAAIGSGAEAAMRSLEEAADAAIMAIHNLITPRHILEA